MDNFPVGIGVNPITNKIYVTNEYSNTVSVVDGINDTEETSIPVGALPYDVDVDHLTNKIYVANLGSDTVSIIDGERNEVVGNVTNITTPVGLDVDSSSSYLYVTSIDNDTVSKVDLVNNKVVDTTIVQDSPYTVDIEPGGNKIYVSNLKNDSVSVINGTTFDLMYNIQVGDRPVGLAASTSGILYVANRGSTDRGSDEVSIINTTSDLVIKNLTVGDKPDGIDINFRTGTIYVTNTGSDTVSIIDNKTNEVVDEIRVNNNISPELESLQAQNEELPPTVEFPNVASFVDTNRDTNMIYVTNTGSSVVSVINGSTNTMQVGKSFKISPTNSGKIECVDFRSNDILKYNTSRYVRFDYDKKLKCTAIPEYGYNFGMWTEKLGSKVIFSITPPSKAGAFISSWFRAITIPEKSQQMDVKATEYGTISNVSFKAGPDYIAILLIPVLTGLIVLGRFIYRKTWKTRRYKDRHGKTITKILQGPEIPGEKVQSLKQIKTDIHLEYAKGDLSEKDHDDLIRIINRHCQNIG